jgi:hypothetical protein
MAHAVCNFMHAPPAGREKCLVLLNSAEVEQQVELSVQLQSPGVQALCADVA